MKKIKPLILIIIILIGLIFGFYTIFFKKEKLGYSIVKVVRGNISEEVSGTGTVKIGEEVNLGFKNSGRIEKIYVKTGDEIKQGQDLAKLDTTQLSIQLKEAQAALEVAQAQLNKLLAGTNQKEIKIAETSLENAKISLESARKNLEDVKAAAKENLDNAYQDALNILNDSYLKIYNASETTKKIQLTYFTKNDQEGIKVKENKDKIEMFLNQAKTYLDKAKTDSKNENIDIALSETKKILENISESLEIIRQVCEEPLYRDIVSSTDKTTLDSQRTNINTALTNVVNSQQTISLTKITNETNIDTAQAQVSTAEGNLKKAEDELSRLLAPPQKEDVDLYQAQVRQFQAKVSLLENQIREAILTSPAPGQITKINKKEGEIIQTTETILSFLPASPFQVKADIYEEDIVKVKTGNQVDITLTALSGKTFRGRVLAINPAEKLIEGVVYYEVTIDFEDPPKELKPGMTADIVIKTAQRDNVLIIPREAVEKKNNKTIVKIKEGKILKEKEIEIGLRGNDGMVEVISGLKEGEEIAIQQ